MNTARRSIAKRVTGAVLSYATQLADAQGRSEDRTSAADYVDPVDDGETFLETRTSFPEGGPSVVQQEVRP